MGVHLRTITHEELVCTTYLPGAVHDGTEGELYVLADDPLQRENRFAEPALASLRDDLISELHDRRPPDVLPKRPLIAPV